MLRSYTRFKFFVAIKEYAFEMGSKLPTDLFPSPDGESQNLLLGSKGRQLRSRLVELCTLCHKPVSAAAGKSLASHIHCTCVTPPNIAVSECSMQMSPKKKKVESQIIESSKRQLFKDSIKMELVESNLQKSEMNVISKHETKSEDENIAKKIEIKSRHACTLCSKCFNTPGKLNQHMFSHTGEKPFVCSHCSKAFSSKFKLVRHILIHSDLRQYRCTVCDRTFHRKDHLKNHSKVHSPIKRRFKCDRQNCSKEYSSILSYRKHIAVHSAEEGNLECKICGKRFETKEETLFHLKVHAGSRSLKTPADRKYHCDHCDRSFFTGKDVRRHLVVHTGNRDFLCQYCPQRFGRKDHLTRHIKKSHSTSSKKLKTKKTLELDKSKSVDNILLEMFDVKTHQKKDRCSGEQSVAGSVSQDLYKMQGLDSSIGVMKLETSPDILPIVTIDSKTSLPVKVDDNLSMYDMPILDTNIPYNKFEHYQFENYSYSEEGESIASSSTHTIMPELMYQQSPPPPYPSQLSFNSVQNENIKVESEYQTENRTSTLDLVLPPITNISPSMLLNSEFQNLLSSNSAPTTEEATNDENDTQNNPDQFYNFLPNSNELIASLLTSQDPQANSAPLPGFSQAFHQPP
ncbi:hypothetical protein PGB90_009088 [Kerria lacca]